MPEIQFQLLGNANGTPSVRTLSGSGIAFFGATQGSSVQIGAYQDTSYVANGDASVISDASNNIKFTTDAYPSGKCTLEAVPGSPYENGVTGVRTMYGTVGVEFGHTSAVNIQNCQLRIYDRGNVNYPASGVNTKVAELVNHNGGTFNAQGSDDGLGSAAQGSGDLWWWGEPWPSEYITSNKNYYTNSVGTVFRNGTDVDTRVNGDTRLASAAVAGSYDTVGGTGIIVPLLDSPGSGQKQLQATEVISGTGMVWPKWTQYITDSTDQTEVFGFSFGDGSDTTKVANLANIDKTFGGTGVDTHHTWSVALSASPLSTGAKEAYGLYVSLEYY
jgi:hypothetical protein